MQRTAQRVVETFDRDNVPHPHEPVHCGVVTARPLCYLECKCGFAGFAHVSPEGKPICPAHLARAAQAEREDAQRFGSPQTSTDFTATNAFRDAVTAAVNTQMEAQNKLIAALLEQVKQSNAAKGGN